MNILVCSRVSIPAKDRTLPEWEAMRRLGHRVEVCHPGKVQPSFVPDVLISMGVTIMDETFQAKKLFPDARLYCYNWDCYEWVWTNPRPGEYDYRRYGELLRLAEEVWVPSDCTGRRTVQWWPWTEGRWHRILSTAPYWEYDDVRDERYVLCTLREIPDPHWGLLEQACKELGLPLVMTRHECSYEDYQRAVAHCRMQVSHCYELSTGGLSLLEGYYHGKPVLMSDSEWHGGKDYFGDRAFYFQAGDVEGLKFQLGRIYRNAGRIRDWVPMNQEWVRANYSSERMVREIVQRIEATR